MELRNPMKGIGFGWSLTGYAQLRVGRTPLSRFVLCVPSCRKLRLNRVVFEKDLNGFDKSFRMLSKKIYIHVLAWLRFGNVAQPGY